MNTILDMIPCVMGLPVISDSLNALIEAMAKYPGNSGLGIIMDWAKMIGLCIALGVGGNECFQMMLGRRGLDVMKLLHIVIISMCITFSGSIADMAALPGQSLETIAMANADGMNGDVKKMEDEIAGLQQQYIEKVRDQLRKLEENKAAENDANSDGILDDLINKIDEIKLGIQNRLKETALLTETKVCEWISLIIRYIGEILFQVAYYGLLISQRIFMHILEAFAPLMFAISLSPHYKSAWSQWLSKYISLSLWGFVTYTCIYYVDYIMLHNLAMDKTSYMALLNSVSADVDGDTNIGAIGMQAVGTTCMYVVGLLVGVRVIAFVPEVASWLMPGGVSSGAGSLASAGLSTAGSAIGMAAGGAAATSTFVATGSLKKSSQAYDKGRNFLKKI